MSKAKPVRLGGLLVLAAALAVVAGLSWSHLQAGPSLAGGGGAMTIDCDAAQAGIQAECSYAPGSNFDIQVHVPTAPSGGYFGFQAKTAWVEGVVNYMPTTAPADEALWPECTVPARTINSNATMLFGCVPFPLPTVGDTFTGAVLQFQFNCKSTFPTSPPAGLDVNQSSLDLVPRAGDSQLGTHFLDANLSAIDPTLTGAVVTCVEPTPTTPPTDGSPTPTTGPGPVDECGASGCTAFDSGDATIEVGDSTELTFLVTGLDETTPAEGVECTFSVTSGGGSVDPATATSDADGLVSTTYTAGDTPETAQVTADCGAYGSSTLGVVVSVAALPGTGVGDTSDNGLSTSIWSIAGALLAAAVAGLGFFGWRYARTDRQV